MRAESPTMRESWASKMAKRFASNRRLSSDGLGSGSRSRRSSNNSRGSDGGVGGGGYQSEGNNSSGTRGSGGNIFSRPHSSASLGSGVESGGEDSHGKNKRKERRSRRTTRDSERSLSRARQMREQVLRHHSVDNSELGGESMYIKASSDHQAVQRSKSSGAKGMSRQVSVNVLSRFLTSSSKHTKANVQDSSGDSGGTCNRMTDDEPDTNGAELQAVVGSLTPGGSNGGLTSSFGSPEGPRRRRRSNESMESVGASGPKFLAPISKVSANVFMSSRNLLASAVPVARRRGSSDGSMISAPSVAGTPRRSSNGSGPMAQREPEEELTYEAKQARLQKLGEDMAKCGELDMAIDFWKESLELAQDNKDSLVNRTEIMCVLMELHFQNSIEKKRTNEDLEEEGLKRPSNMVNSVHTMASGSLHSIFSDDDIGSQPRARSAYYHERQAKRFVHRIKPMVVKPSWIRCSSELLDFLSESEAWELALIVAEKLIQESPPPPYGEPPVDPQHLATLHFQVASQKLDSHKQGEALQHMQETVKCLQQVPRSNRDMMMYAQVLQLLASEYQQQGSFDLALEAYEELLDSTPTGNRSNICCQMAEIYINQGQLDMALEKLESAARKMDNKDEGSSGVIRLQLLQTKGDVLFRLGRMDASMMVYQQALQEANNPADQAKLLYTMGRLCIRLRRTREAISFFSRELEITKQELGSNHLSVSHIYHELAKLYDEGLGEQKMALMKYNKALQIELAVLQECHFGVATCQKCNPIAHRMCELHSSTHTQVTSQIRETKKCQGRMHFKLGDFDKAVRTSLFNEQAPTGTAKRKSMIR